ncbi:MAG TPA: AAA family ATPase [Actinomycetota bacterium]|nr:AAA family ATPase [Actinomycetota bacterium]
MAKMRTALTCRDCGQQVSQWVGRCPSCGAWGTIEQGPVHGVTRTRSESGPPAAALVGGEIAHDHDPVPTGFHGVDRVLGGGLVPASVALLAGEPGIGKSTLLLHLVAHLASQGRRCLLVSGEESHAQVASRARRLGISGDAVRFAPGRDLEHVVQTALAERPFLLAVDSIQAIRDTSGTQMPGGVSQVRSCADSLVGLAKAEGIAVLLTGHVTKDGDLAGPRSLEHSVDAVLTFDGDVRSGLRVLAGGKNRFGAEGETAWFEMHPDGLREIDPTGLLVSGEHMPGAATALAQSGRRALAVEVQALVGSSDAPARRQATGLDARRFQLVAAVLDRVVGLGLGRSELFGASSGGVRVDDPACDLAVAAALASAATGVSPPREAAFVGEVSLTGLVRAAPAMSQRLAAARAAGVTGVFAPGGHDRVAGVEVHPIRHLVDALPWITTAHDPVTSGQGRLSP